MTKYRNVIAAAALLGLAALALWYVWDLLRPDTLVIDAGDPVQVALGQDIYGRECASCHGENLEGQPNWRQRNEDGRLPAPPHDETGHTWHHPDWQLMELTAKGPAALVGGDYQSDMPAYEEILTEAEIRAVLAYIKSRWPPEIRERHQDLNRRAATPPD